MSRNFLRGGKLGVESRTRAGEVGELVAQPLDDRAGDMIRVEGIHPELLPGRSLLRTLHLAAGGLTIVVTGG